MIEYAELDGLVLHDLSIMGDVMVEEVEGITGFSEVRGEVYLRPENNGGVEPDNQYLPPRVSAWTVWCWGSDIAAARANWTSVNRVLLSAMRAPKLLKWRYMGDSLNLRANVRTAGMTPPLLGKDTHGSYFMFQVLLRAADPANYSETLQTVVTNAPDTDVTGLPFPIPFPIPWSLTPTSGGTVDVTNDGDEYAWPEIEIVGPANAPVVGNSTLGMHLYFDDLNLSTGEVLTIVTNPNGRSATVGGENKFSALRPSDSEFFPVSPGATESISFSAQGGGTDPINTTMTVRLRSAYIT